MNISKLVQCVSAIDEYRGDSLSGLLKFSASSIVDYLGKNLHIQGARLWEYNPHSNLYSLKFQLGIPELPGGYNISPSQELYLMKLRTEGILIEQETNIKLRERGLYKMVALKMDGGRSLLSFTLNSLKEKDEQETKAIFNILRDKLKTKSFFHVHDSHMEKAKEMQTSFNSPQDYLDTNYEIYGQTTPARGNLVGGDLYRLSQNNGVTNLIVGDAKGHGMGAFFQILMLSTALQTQYTNEKSSLNGENFVKLNETLRTFNKDRHGHSLGNFVTLASLSLFPSRRIKYFNFGQCPLVVIRDKKVIKIDEGNPPLGFIPNLPTNLQTRSLKKGDYFYLCSDGIPESCDENGEQFGEKKLESIILKSIGASPKQMVEDIFDQVENRTNVTKDKRFNLEDDDKTLVIGRVK